MILRHVNTRARIAALLTAMAMTTPLAAQCPVTEYAVTGSVVATGDTPVANAVVAAEWEEKAAGIASTRTRSGSDGRFALTIQFDTYSAQSFTGKQKCEAKLEQVQVRASAESFNTVDRRVTLRDAPQDVKIELR